MTEAMPDFDNMTPEQIQEWMESLAKRQGATEGFTTEASMDVAEIDPDSVDQSQLGEYIPYGMTREQWEAQLAKEAAEKERKAQSAPQPVASAPKPAPVPPPVAAAPQPVASSGEITMSEAELTDFIVSLPLEKQLQLLEEMGKQQRGEPNILASLLPKLDESTVDQSKITKYVPYGWKEEDWDAHLAKEAAAKEAEKAQAVSPLPPMPIVPPPPMPEIEPVSEFADVLKAPSIDDLFSNQTSYEETDFASSDVADVLKAPSIDDLFSNQTSYSEDDFDFVPTDESETVPSDPTDWLKQLAPETPASNDFDFSSLSESLAQLTPATPQNDDPMSWLAGLAAPDANAIDLNSVSDDLFGLGSIASDPAPVATNPDDPMLWLETLAKEDGAPSEELLTPANANISRPNDFISDGPGYQPYSFEDANDSEQLSTSELDSLFTGVSESSGNDFDDPESWLDALASGVGNGGSDLPMPMSFETPPSLDSSFDDQNPLGVIDNLNAGKDVAPEDVANFFEAMFQRAEERNDVIEEHELEEEPLPIEAEIPDWLQESFASTSTGEMQLVNADIDALLGEDEDVEDAELAKFGTLEAEVVEVEATPAPIPDWLQALDNEPETIDNIFDGGNTIPEPIVEAQKAKVEVDDTDSLVKAFNDEAENQAALQAWFDKAMNRISNGGDGVTTSEETVVVPSIPPVVAEAIPLADAPTVVAHSVGGVLAHVELPIEEELAQGEPIEVPAWLLGVASTTNVKVTETAPVNIVDDAHWFDAPNADSDIPDWLRAQVDDSVIPSGDLPDWLSGSEIDASSDLPDWLRETVDEEVLPQVSPFPAPAPLAPPAPIITSAPTPPPAPLVRVAPALPSVPTRHIIAPLEPAVAMQKLQTARASIKSDVVSALNDYEEVVRSNVALPEVVTDLKKVAEDNTHKKNPTVHRVLGDALMRQGNLQEALATYRKALNLL
jgi:hypothetical protein